MKFCDERRKKQGMCCWVVLDEWASDEMDDVDAERRRKVVMSWNASFRTTVGHTRGLVRLYCVVRNEWPNRFSSNFISLDLFDSTVPPLSTVDFRARMPSINEARLFKLGVFMCC
jgi:hypothetical protein